MYIYHHHTVQVTRAQVRYLRQWVEKKTPPAQVTMGETTTCVQVEYLCQLLREKHNHRKLVPVTTTVRTRCKGQVAGGVHNAAIIVTCVRVHNSNFLGQGMEEI